MRRSEFVIRSAAGVALAGAVMASTSAQAGAQIAPRTGNLQQPPDVVRVVQADAFKTLADGSRSYSGRVVLELNGTVLQGSASSFIITPSGSFRFAVAGPDRRMRLSVSHIPGVHVSTITVQ